MSPFILLHTLSLYSRIELSPFIELCHSVVLKEVVQHNHNDDLRRHSFLLTQTQYTFVIVEICQLLLQCSQTESLLVRLACSPFHSLLPFDVGVVPLSVVPLPLHFVLHSRLLPASSAALHQSLQLHITSAQFTVKSLCLKLNDTCLYHTFTVWFLRRLLLTAVSTVMLCFMRLDSWEIHDRYGSARVIL